MFLFKEGWPYIAIPIAIGIAFFIYARHGGLWLAGVLFLLIGIFFANFFRDPLRKINADTAGLLSPCDGTVLEIAEDEGGYVIRVFLSVFNVHLQRSPCDGKITQIKYVPGKFFAANNPRAHSQNESNTFSITNSAGETIKVKQVAGLLARRIVAWSKVGDELKQGDKIGMIKFGSQVDLFFPKNYSVRVRVGEKVRAGLDLMARHDKYAE